MTVQDRIAALEAIGATQVLGGPIPCVAAVYTPAWTAAQLEAYCVGTAGMRGTECNGVSPAQLAKALDKQLGSNFLFLLDITGYLRGQGTFIPEGVNVYCAFGC